MYREHYLDWELYNDTMLNFDISDCKLMIFDACSTYVEGDYASGAENYDICDMVVTYGVDCVIGWDHPVYDVNNEWIKLFFDRVMRGETIQEAVDNLNDMHNDSDNDDKCSCGEDCLSYDAKIVGNGNFQLYAQQ